MANQRRAVFEEANAACTLDQRSMYDVYRVFSSSERAASITWPRLRVTAAARAGMTALCSCCDARLRTTPPATGKPCLIQA